MNRSRLPGRSPRACVHGARGRAAPSGGADAHEATDLAKGPIALAHLSSRVPAGFHGNWRPGTL